ncbi:hypothetical protein VQ045_12510 [Aurantimonas sp. E1-2-R+4]|uniref:hypothetical protein n=1 Tax=Aurantimonas sp. E1-2-R+4 TaxID=3113714 RepID=UPI002F930D12
MGLFDGLFGGGGGLQSQAPGSGVAPGFMDRMTQMQQTNPEALLALGAGLMRGDMAGGVDGMGQAIGGYRQREAQAGLQREGWDRQDSRFAQSHALDQARFDNTIAAQGSERAQEQQRLNASMQWAEGTQDPEIIALGRMGMWSEAFKLNQQKQGLGGDLQFKILPDGTYGPFNPADGKFEPLGSAPKPNSGGVEIELPDGTRFSSGGTEGQRRNQQLYSVIQPELQTVEQTFGAMTELGNQAAERTLGGAAPFVTSPEFQMGRNSLQTIISSYLYSVSGATANPGEVATQTDMLLPKPGEDPQSTARKLERIRTMVRAVGIAAGAPPTAETPLNPGARSVDDLVKQYGRQGG